MQIKVEIDEKSLNKELEDLKKQLPEETEKLINDTLNYIRFEIITNITKQGAIDTGELRSSVELKNDKNTGEVAVKAPHSVYVEYGTGIYAEGGGRTTPWKYYYPKINSFVVTSGMRPRPYFRPAVVKGGKYLDKKLEEFKLS